MSKRKIKNIMLSAYNIQGGDDPPFLLSLKNVTFKRNEFEIIKHLDISAAFNKICLIKGNIGSGKTTLLKIISKIFPPSSGTIYLEKNGKSCSTYFVHANPEFNFVTGNIADELEIADINSESLTPYLNKDVTELSGGELKKISVLIALNSSADVVVIDEPFEMLDDLEMEDIFDTIKNMSSKKGLILATHENILNEVADYMIYL